MCGKFIHNLVILMIKLRAHSIVRTVEAFRMTTGTERGITLPKQREITVQNTLSHLYVSVAWGLLASK